jgi:hypothetical protein
VTTGKDTVDARTRTKVPGFVRADRGDGNGRVENELHRRLSRRSRTASPPGSPSCVRSSRSALASAAVSGLGFGAFGVATSTGTIAATGFAVAEDEDTLPPVRGLVDELGEVRLSVGEGGLPHGEQV